MAYMDQTKKAAIAAALKPVMPKGWKYTLAVRHHSAIVLTIAEAPVDILGALACPAAQRSDGKAHTHWNVNHRHLEGTFAEGSELLATFEAIVAALNTGNHDRSDIQSDYFDVGHWVDLTVGRWNKPFRCTAAA